MIPAAGAPGTAGSGFRVAREAADDVAGRPGYVQAGDYWIPCEPLSFPEANARRLAWFTDEELATELARRASERTSR